MYYVQGKPGIATRGERGATTPTRASCHRRGRGRDRRARHAGARRRAAEGDPHGHDQAGQARDRDALPRGPFLRPEAVQGRGRGDLGASRGARVPRQRRGASGAWSSARATSSRGWTTRRRWSAPTAGSTATSSFKLGGVRFEVHHFGPAHSPEDLVVVVPAEGVIFSGDILFTGRIPFVGEADSKAWLARIDRLIALKPRAHGDRARRGSRDPAKDLALTRDYLIYLRAEMGKAVEDFVPFEEAYKTHRLEPLREAAGVRRGQPGQRLRHLPADGARVAGQMRKRRRAATSLLLVRRACVAVVPRAGPAAPNLPARHRPSRRRPALAGPPGAHRHPLQPAGLPLLRDRAPIAPRAHASRPARGAPRDHPAGRHRRRPCRGRLRRGSRPPTRPSPGPTASAPPRWWRSGTGRAGRSPSPCPECSFPTSIPPTWIPPSTRRAARLAARD